MRITQYQYNKNGRLIVTYSDKRAMKDQSDREKAVDSLVQKPGNSPSPRKLISNYGYQKYFQLNSELKVSIDQDKIDKESLWDGLHGIFTNIINL